MSEPLNIEEFIEKTTAITREVKACKFTARATIMGFEVEGVELVIACAGAEGLVLSVGDTRVSLTKTQLDVLQVLLAAFDYQEKT